MHLPVPSSNDPTRSSSSRSSGTGTTPVTAGSGIKLEYLHPVLAQDLKDYGRGQQPSLRTLTDGSRNNSPAPSSTETASSGSGSSRSSHSSFHAPPPMHSSGTVPGRQGGEGYYPTQPPRQREGYGGGSSQAPPPAYTQPHQQQQHQQPRYHNQGQYAQRPPHLEQPHTAARYDPGADPAYPERKFATLSCPTMPSHDPTIDMLEASWQTLVEQLGY
ncbi:hypothetical protein BKA70DRAFT_51277 [Coprinopsis sp. MPI-PUGE-AT-0042]|nr:hypothetical protein BKA70DRAFT_51277 [Coprinopsis sp. MPI-PUGE-AT-0042]